MPTERRYIVFSREELKIALNSFNRMSDGTVLRGVPIAVEMRAGEVFARVCVKDGGASREEEISVPADILREAMIRFCFENNIPLHRKAQKSVQIGKDSLAMLMVLGDLNEDPEDA